MCIAAASVLIVGFQKSWYFGKQIWKILPPIVHIRLDSQGYLVFWKYREIAKNFDKSISILVLYDQDKNDKTHANGIDIDEKEQIAEIAIQTRYSIDESCHEEAPGSA